MSKFKTEVKNVFSVKDTKQLITNKVFWFNNPLGVVSMHSSEFEDTIIISIYSIGKISKRISFIKDWISWLNLDFITKFSVIKWKLST